MKLRKSEATNSYLTTQLLQADSTLRRSRTIQRVGKNYGTYLSKARNGIVLDIGPGRGEMLEYFFSGLNLKQVEAIDICKEVVDYCNAHYPYQVTLVDDSAAYLSSHKSKYSAITLMHVLEHLTPDDAIKLLTAAKQALTPKGILIVEVPNSANIFVGNCINASDITHLTAYTNTSLCQIMKLSRFEHIEIGGVKVAGWGVLRIIQRILLTILNVSQKILSRIYLPSERYIHDATIYAIAHNTSAEY